LLTFITAGGVVMRTTTDGISQLGRLTQGVTILNVGGSGDRVAALSCEDLDDEEERSQNVLINMNGDGVGE
jgi:DNA gyrase subunit A